MTEDDTFNALRKISFTEAMKLFHAWDKENGYCYPSENQANEFKRRLQYVGWTYDEFMNTNFTRNKK